MAPKRLQRQGSTISESSSPSDGEGQTRSLTGLTPKPCFTCARQITPRAKWTRNWTSIRYCSDRCKGWRSIVKVAGSTAVERNNGEGEPSLLERCVFAKDAGVMLCLDAWIEATLLHLVSTSRGTSQGVPLQQVSQSLHCQLEQQAATPPAYYATIKKETLQQGPGEREMIRRAARRLVILEPDTWPYSRHFGLSDQRIRLTQSNGKKVLRSLEDVSFAKGEMFAHSKLD